MSLSVSPPGRARTIFVGVPTAIFLFAASSSGAAAQALDVDVPAVTKAAWSLGSVNLANRGLDGGSGSRSSHEVALGYGVSDSLALTFHVDYENIAGQGLRPDHVAIEAQHVFFKPAGSDGLALGWFNSVEVAVHDDAGSTFITGPNAMWTAGPWRFAAAPFFTRTFGRNRGPGLNLAYAWQAKYQLQRSIALALDGFGGIDNLQHAGALSEQDHRAGPTLYIDVDTGEGRTVGIGIGALFGMTGGAPDASGRINVALDF